MSRLNEISMRLATDADCDVLTALMLRSSAYDGRYRRMIENYPVTLEMVQQKEVWVAEQNGQPVGFYRLDVANGDLDLMFVDDRAQGSGLGRAIFDHMKSFAADRDLQEVQIVSHPPSAEFYRRMGATDVGVSKAKGADGWDRPILSLRLG